ncbi:uncharacterized protein LOC123443373 isoform X3 [Hordeum vulgare subsp. vulgare]|uniref:uncharacterized protein LOC123443373 isoform X3 n=1 Tax=Hordeum vulgare subsp. vulgare TaxID=112509 RepID=UPI001D1A5815|nr:uncharacterized protein LOC123443373 isoform X3 [Hordeum vulgare subsp. vulgare]
MWRAASPRWPSPAGSPGSSARWRGSGRAPPTGNRRTSSRGTSRARRSLVLAMRVLPLALTAAIFSGATAIVIYISGLLESDLAALAALQGGFINLSCLVVSIKMKIKCMYVIWTGANTLITSARNIWSTRSRSILNEPKSSAIIGSHNVNLHDLAIGRRSKCRFFSRSVMPSSSLWWSPFSSPLHYLSY